LNFVSLPAAGNSLRIFSAHITMPSSTAILAATAFVRHALAQTVPAAAQIVDQKTFNVLPSVAPPSIANESTVCFRRAAYSLQF
jgi:hypothetical protein